MNDEHELFEIARSIRYDLTVLQAKTTDLLLALARTDLPEPIAHICPDCGVHTRGAYTLAEHQYHSHEGPTPEHWLEAEAKADLK